MNVCPALGTRCSEDGVWRVGWRPAWAGAGEQQVLGLLDTGLPPSPVPFGF